MSLEALSRVEKAMMGQRFSAAEARILEQEIRKRIDVDPVDELVGILWCASPYQPDWQAIAKECLRQMEWARREFAKGTRNLSRSQFAPEGWQP